MSKFKNAAAKYGSFSEDWQKGKDSKYYAEQEFLSKNISENDIKDSGYGEDLYNDLKESYAYPGDDSTDPPSPSTKERLQSAGIETPDDYVKFLESDAGIDFHNKYMSYMNVKVREAFSESGCSSATAQATQMGLNIDFCSGEGSQDAIDKYFEKLEEEALSQAIQAGTATQLREDAIDTPFGGFQEFLVKDEQSRLDASADALKDNLDKLEDDRELAQSALDYARGAQIKFKEQCFLLTHIKTLAELKRDLDVVGFDVEGEQVYNKELPDGTASGNRSLLTHYDPFSFMNRLTQSPNKRYFFDMPSHSLSALQPMIRLYKVISENGKEREVEMKFDSHYSNTDIQDLLNNIKVRGHGVGVKSFDFAYEASNPFAIKKTITAKLVLFANNFRELYREREGVSYDGIEYKDAKYKYLDLALKTGDDETFAYQRGGNVNPQEKDTAYDNQQKLNFRLKAVVGWANPKAAISKNSEGVGTGTIGSSLLDAVYDSYITLNLTPTVHEFDIDDLGRVTFSLNYLAYVEDFFDQPEYNIFSKPEITISQIKRKLQYAEANRKCNSGEAAKLKNDKDQINAINDEKKENLRSLMDNMLLERRIRVLPVDIKELNKYRTGGPLMDLDHNLMQDFYNEIVTAASDDTDIYEQFSDELKVEEEPVVSAYAGSRMEPGAMAASAGEAVRQDYLVEEPATPNETFGNIPFFWVSDLIDVILKYQGTLFETLPSDLAEEFSNIGADQVQEQINNYKRHSENFKKFRVLLGPIELVSANKVTNEDTGDDDVTVETTVVSMGDLPVSVKYFMEFMTEKMLKSDRQVYPIATFLNQFFNGLLADFLNSDNCYGGRTKQKTRLFQTAITGFNQYSAKAPDDITYYMGVAQKTRLDLANTPQPTIDVSGGRGEATPTGNIANETNYLIYYAGRVQPMDTLVGDYAYDTARGIWHYQIGKDTGIVKSISLSKTDSPGLAEVRFEQEGYDGLQQLLVLYDANIKTYLDVSAFPGSYIYVEPRGFDPALDPKQFTTLGIGGYYMITRSQHSLGPGKAETSITAKWVAQIDGDIESDGGITPDSDNCSLIKTTRKEKSLLDNVLGFFKFEEPEVTEDEVIAAGDVGEPSDVTSSSTDLEFEQSF